MKLSINQFLVESSKWPRLAQVFELAEHQTTLKYLDTETFSVSYHTDIPMGYEELNLPMVLYCFTGRSSFARKKKLMGYYYVNSIFDYESNVFLGREIPGKSQEDFKRFYKLRAFL